MRIRKEISKWSIKQFLKLTSILWATFNGFYLLTAYLHNALQDINPTNWFTLCIFYPLLLAAIFTNGFRKGTLYINDYQTIPDFMPKLKKKIEQENMELESEDNQHTVYTPHNWFYRFFNAWSGSEKLMVTWGQEIIVDGALKKVSNLEDILTWNKDFK